MALDHGAFAPPSAVLGVLTRGRADRTLAFEGAPEEVAQGIVSTLEGAMLVARSYGDVARFNATARQLLTSLAT